jgi:hypothetical protein
MQCYDVDKDEGNSLVGPDKYAIPKTNSREAVGNHRVYRAKLSFNGEWLFTIERWKSPSERETSTLKFYKRAATGGWGLFAEVGLKYVFYCRLRTHTTVKWSH